jgi:NADPH:quinone reductase-like Zn-dependent oxidoreductase
VCGLPAIIAADLAWYRGAMNRLFHFAASGQIRPMVQQVFPWSEVENAHAVIAEGKVRGKLLLDFSV